MTTNTVNGRIVIEGHATPAYRQLWRVVDGAVRDAMTSHPKWLASEEAGTKLRNSIVKRAVGAIMGYVGEATVRPDAPLAEAARGRSGFSPAVEGSVRRVLTADDDASSVSKEASLDGAGRELPAPLSLGAA